jgi:hypothetical protein
MGLARVLNVVGRNNYFIMHDSIVKNLDKLKMPRSSAPLPFS